MQRSLVGGILVALAIFALASTVQQAIAASPVSFAYVVTERVRSTANGLTMRLYVWVGYDTGSERVPYNYQLSCTVFDNHRVWKWYGPDSETSRLGSVYGSFANYQTRSTIRIITNSITVDLAGQSGHELLGLCRLSSPSGTWEFWTAYNGF